jgi:predicted solute-binding protein
MKKTPEPLKTLPQGLIGRIPFLVCLPYFWRDLGTFCDAEGSPAELNRAMEAGFIHAAPTSCTFFARHSEEWWIDPHLCTAGRLETRSVLFLGQDLPQNMHRQPIWLSEQSGASILLFQVLCKRWGIEPIWLHEAKDRIHAKAEILIGDQALIARQKPKWPILKELDLLWHEDTGHAFAFGLWTLRRSIWGTEQEEILKERLQRMRWNLQNFGAQASEAVHKWSESYELPLPPEECVAFLQSMDYGLTPARVEGVEFFYSEAKRLGILPQAPKLVFAP